MKRVRAIGTMCLFPLTACATQPSPADHAPGFLLGLLHGAFALPALIGSLALPVRIYAFPNDGFPYDLGFCVGFIVALLMVVAPLIPFIGGFLTRGE